MVVAARRGGEDCPALVLVDTASEDVKEDTSVDAEEREAMVGAGCVADWCIAVDLVEDVPSE